MANSGEDGEAERLKGLFLDVLQECRFGVYPEGTGRETTSVEDRSIDVLIYTSRAMYGGGSDIGVSPLMMEMLRGYMRSCGHLEDRIPELYRLANLRLAERRRSRQKQMIHRERNPRRWQDGP